MAQPGKIKKVVEIDKDIAARFDEIYPQHGAFTWFIRSCLNHFVEAHQMTPDDHVKEAVNATLELEG